MSKNVRQQVAKIYKEITKLDVKRKKLDTEKMKWNKKYSKIMKGYDSLWYKMKKLREDCIHEFIRKRSNDDAECKV